MAKRNQKKQLKQVEETPAEQPTTDNPPSGFDKGGFLRLLRGFMKFLARLEAPQC